MALINRQNPARALAVRADRDPMARQGIRPTKHDARGYVDDRLRRPAAPSPISPPAPPPQTGSMLAREKIETIS